MNRIELIQKIISRKKFKTYLEIGSRDGTSFLPIRCSRKAAIDPEFKISSLKKIWWNIKNPFNKANRYFEETSDEFFLRRKDYLTELGQIDVVLVDGLHTYEAALNDVLNSLQYLSDNGVIIMHDCLPPNAAAATPMRKIPGTDLWEERGWTGNWCGDVWKCIVYLRRDLSEYLDVCVLDTDYGLGVIRIKNRPPSELSINHELFNEVDQISYNEMIIETDTFLELKRLDYSEMIIGREQ